MNRPAKKQYDAKRVGALRKLLVKPMKSADVLAHFGDDVRYRFALYGMVACGEVVNLNPVPKAPGLFILVTHAPANVTPKVAARKVGRPAGTTKPLTLDWATGAHLNGVWGGLANEVRG
jgi:hypothetical protein